MLTEKDVQSGGRTLHAYSRGAGDLAVMWHHGTPNIGSPPAPLFAAADRLGIRFIAYDRPGYGGSTPNPGRDVASAAADAAAVADALGVGEFAVLSHSGGGPCALACAALLPGRVTAAATISSLAPFDAAGLDWFAGMGPAGEATLRAAGRPVGEMDPDFLPADWQALTGEWGWFGGIVEAAMAAGPGPQYDDDLSYVRPWGFDPATITARTLLVHGTGDLVVPAAHSSWLAAHIPGATLRLADGEGHISVLPPTAVAALEWLRG